MFLKVFKYDFKSVLLKLFPVFILLPLFAGGIRVINMMNFDNSLSVLIILMTNGFFILLLAFAAVFSIVMVVIRYTKALFKSQGYLTHTLPVSKHVLLLSQILVSLLASVCTYFIIFASIAIAYISGETIDSINTFLNELFEITLDDLNVVSQIISSFFDSLISSLKTTLLLFLGIALGHAHSKNKNMLSIVYCFALSFGLSLVTNIINLLFSNLIEQTNSYELVKTIEGVLIIVGAYFMTVFTMKKQLNLE